jgi:hypothetical protein
MIHDAGGERARIDARRDGDRAVDDPRRAGIGRAMIHDAAVIGRSMIHDAPGGLTPTPAMPGMGRLWGFATTWHHRLMSAAWGHYAALIAHRSPQPFKTPRVDRSVGRFRRGGS